MNDKLNNAVESAVSYAIGFGVVKFSFKLADLATHAQQIAMIVGCFVIIIRFIHDAIGLYRRIRHGK